MIRLVHLDDSRVDQELIARELKREGLEFTCRHVSDRETFIQALETFDPDVILSDFSLASFSGLEALAIAREKKPDAPLIFVTGTLGEERAVDLLKKGAFDYILKNHLQRLVPAVERARKEADSRREQKKVREEREFLNKVLDFSGALIFVLDEDGRFLKVNEGFTKATGYTKDEVIGRFIFDLIETDEYEEQAPADLKRVLQTGTLEILERSILTKTGERRDVRWEVDLLQNNGGTRLVATGIDVTDLKEAESRRGVLEAQLEQSQRIESLGRVAANVAHEFNNVLMGIQPFADIVARTAGDNERLVMCADQISRSIQRGARITREVLRFARPAEPVRDVVRAGQWIGEVIADSNMIVGDQIKISVSIEDDSEIAIDRSQLEQVVVNLLLNARDAMGGGGRVDITVSPAAEDGRYSFGVVPDPERHVHIELRDQGAGVPVEIRDRLFEPFFTTKPKGTGLGLAVSHQIVRAHDGQMFVESEEGKGASFHLFLPKLKDPANAAAMVES